MNTMAATQLVPADCSMECFIFVLSDDFVDVHRFDDLFCEIKKYAEELSQDYIWHKDPFRIHKRFCNDEVSLDDSNADLPSHFYGMCFFGDSIEDEWFVVYILKQLSEKFHNLAIKVTDSDGEFLLIEAANALPEWINPYNSTNRVYFHNGTLYLLSPNENEIDSVLSVKDALEKLKKKDKNCLASEEIMEHIAHRIQGYPEKIKESFHTTTIYAPVGVAALLKEDSSLISAAVHAFCTRDSIDNKVCRAMKYFPPENRVNTSVKFTKCLYAMLMHSVFNPDRRTGWNMPLSNSSQYKSHSMGAKLACGFEILVSEAKPNDELESNKAWETYINSLKKRNYFQNYIEHSKPYNLLLENAKDYFINNLQSVKIAPVVGMKILDMLKTMYLDEKVFHENESDLPKDDDDGWLTIDPEDLETMMQNRYGKKSFYSVNDDVDASKFSGKVNDFLEHISGIDGVEFPGKNDEKFEGNMDISDPPVRPKRGIKVRKGSKGESSTSESISRSPSLSRKYNIDFDADQFTSAIQNILDLVIPEDNWKSDSESELSDYGSDDDIASNIFDLKSDCKKEDSTLKEYMKEMDSQLSLTSIGNSFETIENSEGNISVDVDKTALKNILTSYKGEEGGSGAAGNILGPLGLTKITHFNSIDEEVD